MTGQNTSSAVMAQRKGGKPKKNAKPEDMEREGLDITSHGESAYHR